MSADWYSALVERIGDARDPSTLRLRSPLPLAFLGVGDFAGQASLRSPFGSAPRSPSPRSGSGTSQGMAQDTRANPSPAPGIWESLNRRIQVADYRPEPDAAVIARELKDRRGAYFVLKNTREKTYLRLSAAEHELWARMDGKTSVQELVVEHFMATGAFAHHTIARLVDLLRQHHMLADRPVAVWSELRQKLHRRSRLHRISVPAQALLTRRLNIEGIDRVVSVLYRAGGWLCFTRPAQIVFLLISVLGLLAFFTILGDPRYIFLGDDVVIGLAVLWLASIGPVVIHELGHALTVKHYGREVPRGGLMLYFGMPAAFVETTDIWLEPRRARLAVTWNGPYTGLILGGAASLVMFLLPALSLNSLLFKLAGFAYLTVFFNVNPLLKLDGYYLLSDALDIPSLREKSVAFIRHKLPAALLHRKRLTREELTFTVFGVLSMAWTLYALYMIFFFWETRVRSGVQVALSGDFPLLPRLLNLLLVGAVISFVFLILLQLLQAGRMIVARFSRSGVRARHGRLAIALAGVALAIGLGAPLIASSASVPFAALPGSARDAPYGAAVLGLLASLLAMARLLTFNRPYGRSPRGVAHITLAIALCLSGLAQVARLLPESAQLAYALQGAALLALLAVSAIVMSRAAAHMKPASLLAGLVVGSAWLASLNRLAGLPLTDPRLVLMTALGAIGTWALLSVQGSARAPAVALLGAGATAVGLSWLEVALPLGDLSLIGALLIAAGALHLVEARLPQLSAYDFGSMTSQTQQVVAASVPILIRRVIAQVFFETGWPGVRRFGRGFTEAMRRHGVSLSIAGNRFEDPELSRRPTAELGEVYGVAFDELYRLIRRELGPAMARLTFGYGVDSLPWQNREVVAETILGRRAWGLSVKQAVADERASRQKTLGRVPLFVACTYAELADLADQVQAEQFAAGEDVIRQGDAGDKFYVVERGKLSVWQTDAYGVESKVGELGPGQYFGEVALISNAPRNATVRADTPVAVLMLDRASFDHLVREQLAVAQHVQAGIRRNWLLRAMPIFDELESLDLDLLAARMQRETFKAGEVVFREGERGDKFYIIESGQVSVTHLAADGQTVELARLGPGEYVGEIALLQNSPRTATITASVDSTLLSLPAQYFHEFITDFMQLGHALSRTSSRRLSMGGVFSPAPAAAT